MENNNLQHLYVPTRNWYIYCDNIRRYHCITWENVCMICIYLPETDTFMGMWMFPAVYHMEFSYALENPHYYPRMFYQLLYSNQYYLNTNLVYHTYTNTHTSLKVPFSSLSFCLWNQFGYLNSLKYLNEWQKITSEKKGQVENSLKQLELKHVPFTSAIICYK